MNTDFSRPMIRLALVALLLGILAILAPLSLAHASDSGPLTFTSGGHVLGFRSDALYVASRDHALRVEFVNAHAVTPHADDAADANATGTHAAPALTRVAYANLWEGITLAYDAPGGTILRSTYTVAPHADPAQIRLRYNVPLNVNHTGELALAFQTGTLSESAPIAWQDIGNTRVPVQVGFQTRGEYEVGLRVGAYDATVPLYIDPTLSWTTFLGGAGTDTPQGIAVDSSLNVYVSGYSNATWGAPIRAFNAATQDAYVAKLSSSGALIWNTFLGGTGADQGYGIAADSSGNVYVVGLSDTTWGTPLRAFSGGIDAFAAKLDASGTLLWHTFLGSSGTEQATGITADSSGNIHVSGLSTATWGTPVRAFSGAIDTFVVDMDTNGTVQWNTFVGGTGSDQNFGIARDSSDNVYVSGISSTTWGTPVRAFSAGQDAYVAKVNSSGSLVWNTFLGGTGTDAVRGIAVDSSGNLYVGGYSSTTWGTPLNAYTSGTEGYIAKLNTSGALQWHTFFGGTGADQTLGIALDSSNNVYVVGNSTIVWGGGNPISGTQDAFVAGFSPNGTFTWNKFLGGTLADQGWAIAVDGSSNVYATGLSNTTWGSPIRSYSASADAFVANISPQCTAVQTGSWSASATWSCGRAPSDGDNAVIGSGNTVTLDVNTANLRDVTLNGGVLTNNGTARTVKLTGNWNNSGTFTPDTFIDVTFAGTITQTLTGATTFNSLTISNTVGSVTLANDMTVNGTLTLNSDLTTSSNVLNLGSSATVAGTGDVVGTVRRTNPATGADLQFNNQYSLLNFATAPTQMDVVLTKAIPPSLPTAVQRSYTLTPTGPVNATVQLSYQTGELNGNTEANLQLWRYNGSSWDAQGGTVNTTNHYVSVSNISQFSPWGIGEAKPTAVEVTRYQVQADKRGNVNVKWTTANELNVRGFNVWRKTANGAWTKLNLDLMTAKHIGQAVGDTYHLTDKDVKAGKTYRYKIEIVHADGTTQWTEIKSIKLP